MRALSTIAWTSTSGSIREQADEYARIFGLISRRPLRPYFAVVGREFLAWLELEI